MTAAELRALLADVPDDAEVVGVERHSPMIGLGPDDYDDYAGLPTGKSTSVTVQYRDGRVWIDMEAWQ